MQREESSQTGSDDAIADANLCILSLFASLHGQALDIRQLHHQFCAPGALSAPAFGSADMLRALADLGYEARRKRGSLARLSEQALPLLLEGRDGRFLLLGRIDTDAAGEPLLLAQRAGEATPRRY